MPLDRIQLLYGPFLTLVRDLLPALKLLYVLYSFLYFELYM